MNAAHRDKYPPPPGGAKRRRWLWGLFGTVGVVVTIAVLGWAWVWFAPCWAGGCAPVQEMARFQAEGSQLLDVEGQPFATLATVNRRVVPLDSLPEHLIQAYIAIEDRRFFSHGGVDWRRMGGAVRQTASAVAGSGGRVEGGSTITMQLARNLFPEQLPYSERSMRRKLMEARIARQIERTFSKEKILELYLNHIYLGSGAYGVEAAAQTYFGRPAAEVDLAEAAVLAALPQAPSVLDPTRNPEAAQRRRNLVLSEMAEAGFITREEAEAAREHPIRLTSSSRNDEGFRSSYFVERVRRELEERVGSHFYTAGLRVHTTLDARAQAAAEEELKQQLERIEGGQFGSFRHDRFADTRGVPSESGETPYLQGAVVVLDAATGAVRALVGGRDWDDSKFDRATQARRQPGSAFKPFVFLSALERMRTPVDLVDDSPLRMELSGGRVWEPRNFGGEYDEMITLREALTRSKNTATVRLATDVGMGPVVRTARELGVESDLPEYPATALGAAEVRPLELVTAYAAFANGGYSVEPHFVQRVEDRNGRVLWEASPRRRQVVDPKAAFVLTSILQDVVERGTATAVRGAGFRIPAAGKTGTTNDNTDVWFIGYTPELVGGVWIGFDQPRTIIPRATGGSLAAPVWARVMARAHEGRPAPEAWQPPAGVQTGTAERRTGAIVSADCPAQGATYTEFFVGTPPRGTCRRDLRSPSVAASDPVWGDEEAGGLDTLADRGIDWPELEERLGSPASADRQVSPPAEPRPRVAAQPRTTQRVDTVVPEIREEDLPGVPVQRGNASGDGRSQERPAEGSDTTDRPRDRSSPPDTARRTVREEDLPGVPVTDRPPAEAAPQREEGGEPSAEGRGAEDAAR
jgi:penicillin-binding protein 1A